MNQEYKTPDFSQGSIKSNEEVIQEAIVMLDRNIKEIEQKIANGNNYAHEDLRIKQKNRRVLAERLRNLQNNK
mgnify:CR=1 FL=1